MSSSFTTTQSQRRDSGSSDNHTIQSLTSSSSSSSGRVVPGAKTSGQNGKGAISSSTTFPPSSSANAPYQTPNSPQPSQVNSASSPALQRGSATNLTPQDVGRWSHAVQGADMPEEVKAIVRTGTHTWSRGITQKTAAPAARG